MTTHSIKAKPPRTLAMLKAAALALLLSLTLLAGQAAAQEPATPSAAPTVDGLFYGPAGYPDSNNYIFLSSNPGRGDIHYYLDGTTLYVAVVVQRSANDNVFAITSGGGADQSYVISAGWSGGGANHRFSALTGSDHMELELSCDNGAIDESWIHGYVYDADNDSNPAEADWLSGPGDNSQGGPPPTDVTLIATASSLMWNLNNYASGGSPGWDITLGGTRTSTSTYKSPASGGATDDDVTDEDGYPADENQPITFDETHGWEWPLVYEMAIDVTNCAGTPISLNVPTAHNSPAKEGGEDVPIVVIDRGDLPDTYTTTVGNGGAQHQIQIGDPILGSLVDGEPDGQPTASATGDNANGSNDEDGILFDTFDWYDGSGEIVYTVSNANGCLNMWVDFANNAGVTTVDGDGTFGDSSGGVSEHVIQDLAVTVGANQNHSFTLPPDVIDFSTFYVRARITPRDGGGGCTSLHAYPPGLLAADPNGPVIGGEVEDYFVLLPGPTAISLQSVNIGPAGQAGLVLAAILLLGGLSTLAYVVARRRAA